MTDTRNCIQVLPSFYWMKKKASIICHLTEKYLQFKISWDQKCVNLQYNMLVRWADGTNDSLTKCLMFQVSFFFHEILQNSLQKPFQLIFQSAQRTSISYYIVDCRISRCYMDDCTNFESGKKTWWNCILCLFHDFCFELGRLPI